MIPIAIHHLSYGPYEDNFFYLHWHYEFEFIVVLEWAVLYTMEEQEYCVTAGEGLFVHSNKLHAARAYNGMPCEACVVLFHPSLFGENKQGTAYSKFVYPILNGSLIFEKHLKAKQWQQSVIERIIEIDAIRNENVSENELILKSKLFEIWHLCFSNSITEASHRRDRKNYKLERM